MADAMVIQWDEVPAEEGPGATRRHIGGVGATLTMVSVKAGTAAPRHSHTHEQFIHVLSGSGRLDCAAGTVPLVPGTVIRFAPDAWHSAVFDTDTVLVEVNLRPKG